MGVLFLVGKGGRYKDVKELFFKSEPFIIEDQKAEMIVEGERFFIRPLDNTIIFVNGERISFFRRKLELHNDSELQLGDLRFKVNVYPCLGKNIAMTLSVLNSLLYKKAFPVFENINHEWLQFDRNGKKIDTLLPDEESAAESISKGKGLPEEKKFSTFFKLYLFVSPQYLFVSLDTLLNEINRDGLSLISGKVAIDLVMYTEEYTPKIVLYLMSEEDKNRTIATIKRIDFGKAKIKHKIEFAKEESPFLSWNQGGMSIRRAAEKRGELDMYFCGKNYHLIKEEVL